MKLLSVATVLSLAMAAAAAPQALEARTGGSGGGGGNGNDCPPRTCTNQQKQVCCTGSILGCIIQVVGATCSGSAYCCNTNSPLAALINISALNCISVL